MEAQPLAGAWAELHGTAEYELEDICKEGRRCVSGRC